MKKSIKVFSIFSMGFSIVLNAGLTDFKTIRDAKEAYEAKEYTASAALLKSLEAKSPEKSYNIGNAYYKAKRYDEAIKAYEQAQGVDESARLHNIANSYFQKNELKKAIDTYEDALKIKEDEATRFNLELAKEKMKQQEEKNSQQQNDKQENQKEKEEKSQQKQNGQSKKQQNKEKNQSDQQDKEDNQPQSSGQDTQDNSQQQNKNQNKQDTSGQENQDEKKQKMQEINQEQKKQEDRQAKDKTQKNDKDAVGANQTEEKNKPEDADSALMPVSSALSAEEKLKNEELKRLLKKTGAQKMPALMYPMETQKTQRREDAKPW